MAKKKSNGKIWWLVLVPVVLAVLGILFLKVSDFAVLDAHGQIAQKERSLLMITTGLGLLVVVPVFIMSYTIAWRYREGNTKARYSPDFDHNTLIEAVWWAIPCIIILILAAIAWRSSHQLDPTRQLASPAKPLQVQVIALQWRWLFIYPEQGIATLNYLELPAGRPINFDITSDAPMNSFWIPHLGGQIYAMAGMSTQLHLEADKPGVYRGSSANISGEGFAGMTFDTKVVEAAAFDGWTTRMMSPDRALTVDEYLRIAKPSKDKRPVNYSYVSDGLYNDVIMQYMAPGMALKEVGYAR